MSNKVAFVAQQNYELSSLKRSILNSITLCGFDLAQVKGKKVFLKPNLLGAYLPEKGITTCPAFLETVANIFIEAGASVSIGDSPNRVHDLETAWEVSGFNDVCKKTGATKIKLEASGSVNHNGIHICKAPIEADILVNIPKFKTHGLTILTLAVKNLFGCVSGMQKTLFHLTCKKREDFARMLVQVADFVRPELTIIDGIIGMDGNGPSAGDLREIGVVIAGTNIHSIDAACCKFVGLKPEYLDTLSAAKEFGLWNETDEIDIVGDDFESLKPKDFQLPATFTKGLRDMWIPKFILSKIWSNLYIKPYICNDICTKCLLCLNSCPVSAIRLAHGGEQRRTTISQINSEAFPVVDQKKCIECFCCHEVCPSKAISLKESLLVKIWRKFAVMNGATTKQSQERCN